MHHGKSTEWKKDNAASLKELLGKWFFLLYSLVYAGFIFINVMSPKFMGIDVSNWNVAILYGIGLITLAMVLAAIYNHISTHAEELLNPKEKDDENK
ncbi:MAG: DUF485 domain-containing protein [Elusimicrobia bacterium]|nr:DUF485 domain-containing protein [Elusimicrobiota bacterium]MBU2614110.1 DUF485 domain-containing protein [Elusimicrobiota bacterium]